MLMTSISSGQYEWLGEKPGAVDAEIAGVPVQLADFGRFKVAWYAKGEVLFIVVAQNDQLLRSALLGMPRPEGTPAA